MAKKYSGGFEFPTGVKRQAAEPLDDSEIVEVLNDLKTLEKCYKMQKVGVLETLKYYMWNGLDQTNLDNWEAIGASLDDPTTDGRFVRQKLGNAYSWQPEATQPSSGSSKTPFDAVTSGLKDSWHYKIVSFSNTINFISDNVTLAVFDVDFVADTIGAEIDFKIPIAQMEDSSLATNITTTNSVDYGNFTYVFDNLDVTINVFRNDAGKYCIRGLNDSKSKQIDDVRVIPDGSYINIKDEDAHGCIHLEGDSYASFATALRPNKVFSFRASKNNVGVSEVRFNSTHFISEVGGAQATVELSAGERLLVTILPNGLLCID